MGPRMLSPPTKPRFDPLFFREVDAQPIHVNLTHLEFRYAHQVYDGNLREGGKSS